MLCCKCDKRDRDRHLGATLDKCLSGLSHGGGMGYNYSR